MSTSDIMNTSRTNKWPRGENPCIEIKYKLDLFDTLYIFITCSFLQLKAMTVYLLFPMSASIIYNVHTERPPLISCALFHSCKLCNFYSFLPSIAMDNQFIFFLLFLFLPIPPCFPHPPPAWLLLFTKLVLRLPGRDNLINEGAETKQEWETIQTEVYIVVFFQIPPLFVLTILALNWNLLEISLVRSINCEKHRLRHFHLSDIIKEVC